MQNHLDRFPKMSDQTRLNRLALPTGRTRIVIDTDTYNEIDDQFAVVWAMLSPEQLSVEAIYAAPFLNHRSSSAEDGMEKSYDEIIQLLTRLDISAENLTYKGATSFLQSYDKPVESAAVTDLIDRAMASPDDDPLYVMAIGAITNIASAILIEPKIIEKIVLIWLGGNAFHWPHNYEFNLKQDVLSSRLVFDCGVPMVQLPCAGVVSHLHSTVPELAEHVKGKGAIGDFLYERFCEYNDDHVGWSKEIWDLAAFAWLLTPEAVKTNVAHSPFVTDHCNYSFDDRRHLILYAHDVRRDPIFKDFYQKLAAFAETPAAG